MHKILSEEKLVELRCAFDLFDNDNDGKINPSELGRAIEKMGQKLTEEDLKEMMRISERIKELQSIIAATKEESVYSKQLRQCEKEVENLKEMIQMK